MMTRAELRAVCRKIAAKEQAARRAEAQRWHGLSQHEKWAEMAAFVGRARRGLTGQNLDDLAMKFSKEIL